MLLRHYTFDLDVRAQPTYCLHDAAREGATKTTTTIRPRSSGELAELSFRRLRSSAARLSHRPERGWEIKPPRCLSLPSRPSGCRRRVSASSPEAGWGVAPPQARCPPLFRHPD